MDKLITICVTRNYIVIKQKKIVIGLIPVVLLDRPYIHKCMYKFFHRRHLGPKFVMAYGKYKSMFN